MVLPAPPLPLQNVTTISRDELKADQTRRREWLGGLEDDLRVVRDPPKGGPSRWVQTLTTQSFERAAPVESPTSIWRRERLEITETKKPEGSPFGLNGALRFWISGGRRGRRRCGGARVRAQHEQCTHQGGQEHGRDEVTPETELAFATEVGNQAAQTDVDEDGE